jgi:hypothetical protein
MSKILLSVMMLVFFGRDTSLQTTLETLVWKNRVLVLYSPQPNDAAFVLQKQRLKEQKAQLLERDLVMIECVEGQLSSEDMAYLKSRFSYQSNHFGVWLIGKDGGIKSRSDKPLLAQDLFALIDAMPMRRAEMHKN